MKDNETKVYIIRDKKTGDFKARAKYAGSWTKRLNRARVYSHKSYANTTVATLLSENKRNSVTTDPEILECTMSLDVNNAELV